jgi:aldehyde dehydrogenase (NAD+)
VSLVVAEAGSTVAAALSHQVTLPLLHLEWWADAAARDRTRSLAPRVTRRSDGTSWLGGYVVRQEPVGVVAAITPFNFPLFLNLWKVGPALAMGNTVVLKPSPLTPFSALVLAEAADEAELPAGTLNVVTGGPEVGRVLTTDPAVDMVTFTGSDLVGAAIMGQASPGLKRVLLELGGKSALIVRADADLDLAAATGAQHLTFQAGQGCALCTRHLVHASVLDRYLELLVERIARVRVGDPGDPAVAMGPLIRPAAVARVEGHVANDSPYGLSGAVISRDLGAAYELACRLRTGEVNLNGGAGLMSPDAPFGGVKRSGLGRELGEEGLAEYCQVKTIKFHAG